MEKAIQDRHIDWQKFLYGYVKLSNGAALELLRSSFQGREEGVHPGGLQVNFEKREEMQRW